LITVAAFVLSIAWAPSADAAAGDLDPAFGGDGTVTTNFTDRADVAYPMALQPDGKIVVAGQASCCGNGRFALARYDTDGSLDTSFSQDGKATTNLTPLDDVAYGLGVRPDGKIVAVGTAAYEAFALVQYNPDGSLDTGFGDNGVVTTEFSPRPDYAYGMALEADGKIVAAGDAVCCGGQTRFAVARYNVDGSLDTTFGGDGTVTTDVTRHPDDGLAVAVEPSGTITVVGGGGFGGSNEKFAAVRYDPDGSLDTSFGGDGIVLTDFSSGPDVAFAVVVEPNGSVVAAGGARLGAGNPRWALARYTADGSLDPSFGGDGKVTTDFTGGDDDAYSLALQPDGKIVAVGQTGGSNPKFGVVRYDDDGSLDVTFSDDGKLTTDFTRGYDSAYMVVLQSDGRIVAGGTAGFNRFALARYLAS